MGNPVQHGEKVRIMNQMTETHRVVSLAELVAELTGAEIQFLDNPRKEADENELNVKNDALISLGLEPITLRNGLLEEIMEVAT